MAIQYNYVLMYGIFRHVSYTLYCKVMIYFADFKKSY